MSTADTASVDSRVKRCKRSNKENIGESSDSLGPVKKPRGSSATADEMKPVAVGMLLQDQIDKEYKIRDGATKLLQVCKHGKRAVEASKGLFVSNAKIIALMKELQRCNAEGYIGPTKEGADTSVPKPCKAQIAISDIRIPLEWRDFDQTKIKTELGGSMMVFCLLKLGTQVVDTSLMEVEKNALDITFPDKIIFHEMVSSDFQLEVELYLAYPSGEHSSSKSPSTPVKMFKKLKKDKSDDVSISGHSQPGSPYVSLGTAVTPTHRFVQVGHLNMELENITSHEVCETYSLTKEAAMVTSSKGTSSTISVPLWGQFCCRLMAQPECATTVRIQGFINVQQMVSNLPAWMRLWCVMRQNTLRCWTYPEDVGRKMPSHSFSFTEGTSVEVAPRLEMRRPNTLIVKNKKFAFYISCESKEERDVWSDAISQAVLDLQVWRQSVKFVIPFTAERQFSDMFPMEYAKMSTSPSKMSIKSGGRKGSTKNDTICV